MSQVAIVNRSNILSDKDGLIITNALNMVLPKFCLDWSLSRHTCVYVAKDKPTTILLRILLLDVADQPGVVAYHDEKDDVPYGKVFVKTILDNNGVLLYSPNPVVFTVSEAVCHELFEMLIEPNCNTWVMLPDNRTLYAYEVCDPVQSNPVTVQVQTGTMTTGTPPNVKIVPVYTKVGLSDWLLPNWFDPQKKRGPYNNNNTLNSPLTIDKNGYVISLKDGICKPIWGAAVTPDRQRAFAAKQRVLRHLTT